MILPPSRAPAHPLRETLGVAVQRALELHPRKVIDVPERRKAAVLLPLFERDDEPWLVLTKRTDHVSTHKGQISFPGGAHDAEDPDLWSTAVRETCEELGVDPGSIRQLGELDDYPTFSAGYIVSPFVGTMAPPDVYRPSEFEIAEVLELPLATLAGVARLEHWEREGVRYPMHVFDVGEHRIWGVTAFILRRFLDVAGDAIGVRAAG